MEKVGVALSTLASKMSNPIQGVIIRDRKYLLKTYPSCFVGREAVDWLLARALAKSREDAVVIGNQLLKAGYIYHVTREHDFKDDNLYFRFQRDDVGRFSDANKEGFLVKQGGIVKNWKRRWCIIKDDYLYYFRNKGDEEEAGRVRLKGSKVEDARALLGRQNVFSVLSEERTYYFVSEESEQDMRDWMAVIERKNAPPASVAYKVPQLVQVQTYNLYGVMCECCLERVKQLDSEVQGIQQITLNPPENDRLTVRGKVGAEQIINTLAEMGFFASVHSSNDAVLKA